MKLRRRTVIHGATSLALTSALDCKAGAPPRVEAHPVALPALQRLARALGPFPRSASAQADALAARLSGDPRIRAMDPGALGRLAEWFPEDVFALGQLSTAGLEPATRACLARALEAISHDARVLAYLWSCTESGVCDDDLLAYTQPPRSRR